jgi:hypothetical protein
MSNCPNCGAGVRLAFDGNAPDINPAKSNLAAGCVSGQCLSTTGSATGLTPNYVGKIVFLERLRTPEDTDRTYSSYYNGEYFITTQSPFTLYGVKLVSSVYEGHQVKAFALIGRDRYIVVSSAPLSLSAREIVLALWQNACAVDRKEKLFWVEQVYHDAKRNALQMANMIGVALPIPTKPVVSYEVEARVKKLEDRFGQLCTNLRAV